MNSNFEIQLLALALTTQTCCTKITELVSSSVKLHFYLLGKDRNSHCFGFSFITYEFSLNLIQLLESNVVGVFPKALTAKVQTVFADHTMSVGACTAVK